MSGGIGVGVDQGAGGVISVVPGERKWQNGVVVLGRVRG
jgi:hypothetical protein